LPDVAVVIPTRGRETRLAFALEALAAQTLDPERFEVVVVRDEDAREPLAPAPARLRARSLTRPGVAGPTAKRNFGWRASEAPLVVFTDDDCRPAPGWLEGLLEVADGGAVFVQGRTEPDPDERHLLHGLARSQEITGPSGWFETCNMAYPRELLEQLGGFDESFPFGGEDTDLGYRAIAAGARSVYADGALVWHAVISRTLPRALREAAAWREVPAVVARHPELGRVLHRGVFWKRTHARLPLAGLGLVLRRRHPWLGLALAIPYLELRVNWREPTPRRLLRQLLTVPAWAAIDAVEIASRLPAAVRHRAPVI
jgi:GT2 family glycosyltransferase